MGNGYYNPPSTGIQVGASIANSFMQSYNKYQFMQADITRYRDNKARSDATFAMTQDRHEMAVEQHEYNIGRRTKEDRFARQDRKRRDMQFDVEVMATGHEYDKQVADFEAYDTQYGVDSSRTAQARKARDEYYKITGKKISGIGRGQMPSVIGTPQVPAMSTLADSGMAFGQDRIATAASTKIEQPAVSPITQIGGGSGRQISGIQQAADGTPYMVRDGKMWGVKNMESGYPEIDYSNPLPDEKAYTPSETDTTEPAISSYIGSKAKGFGATLDDTKSSELSNPATVDRIVRDAVGDIAEEFGLDYEGDPAALAELHPEHRQSIIDKSGAAIYNSDATLEQKAAIATRMAAVTGLDMSETIAKGSVKTILGSKTNKFFNAFYLQDHFSSGSVRDAMQEGSRQVLNAVTAAGEDTVRAFLIKTQANKQEAHVGTDIEEMPIYDQDGNMTPDAANMLSVAVDVYVSEEISRQTGGYERSVADDIIYGVGNLVNKIGVIGRKLTDPATQPHPSLGWGP